MAVQLVIVAIAMLLAGVAALRHQSRAATCPRHSRWAGRIGVVLAWLSQIAGVGLLCNAVVLYRTDSDRLVVIPGVGDRYRWLS